MFRRDRGDADPVLTIAAMAVGLLISASIIAATVHVIQTGQKTVQEGQRAITLSTAQRMWAQDAGNASIVRVEGRSAIQFYETNGGDDSAVFTRGSVPPPCRVSSWTIDHSAGTLTDTVSTYANPQCDLDNVSAHPTSTSTVIKLAGLGSAATIQTTNPAGRDLHFDNAGTEIGLDAGSAPADRSAAVRSSWWHDGEWASAVVRGASVAGEISLPISGSRPLGIAGSTHLAAATVRAVVSAGGGASLKQYQPVPPSFTVKQSTTAGKTFYGKHEAVEVQIANGKCGPYSTQYTAHLNPSTAGVAPITKKLAPSFAASLKVTLAPVPNGSAGTVTVSAECPAAVQLGAATKASKTFTQALPAPILKGTTSGSKHNLSWGRVSSLPTSFHLTERINGGASIPVATLAGTSYTHGWGHYNSVYAYRVDATVAGHTVSSNTVSILTRPAAPRPTVTVSNAYPAPYEHFTVRVPNTCANGTSESVTVWTSGSGTRWTSFAFSDYWTGTGTKYYYAQVTCSNKAGSSKSATSSVAVHVTAPTPSAPSGCGSPADLVMFGATAINSYVTGCNTSTYATRYQAGAQYLRAGGWSVWTSIGSSSPRIQALYCTGTEDGSGITAIYARERAGNSSWGNWRTWMLSPVTTFVTSYAGSACY